MMRKGIVPATLAVVLVLGAALFMGGCGKSESEKAQEAYDQDVQSLKDAATAFADPATYSSVENLKATFSSLETAYNNSVTAAQNVKDAKISGLQSAWNELKTDVVGISNEQTLSDKLDALKAAINSFISQLQQI